MLNLCQAMPHTNEGILVQLLLPGTAIIGMHHVKFGFWYTLPHRRGVGVCGDGVRQKSKFLDIFTPPYRFQRSKSYVM